MATGICDNWSRILLEEIRYFGDLNWTVQKLPLIAWFYIVWVPKLWILGSALWKCWILASTNQLEQHQQLRNPGFPNEASRILSLILIFPIWEISRILTGFLWCWQNELRLWSTLDVTVISTINKTQEEINNGVFQARISVHQYMDYTLNNIKKYSAE